MLYIGVRRGGYQGDSLLPSGKPSSVKLWYECSQNSSECTKVKVSLKYYLRGHTKWYYSFVIFVAAYEAQLSGDSEVFEFRDGFEQPEGSTDSGVASSMSLGPSGSMGQSSVPFWLQAVRIFIV